MGATEVGNLTSEGAATCRQGWGVVGSCWNQNLGEAAPWGRQGASLQCLQRGDRGDRAGVQATQSGRRVGGSEGLARQEMQTKTLLVLLRDWETVFPWVGQTRQVFIISRLRFQSPKEPKGPHCEPSACFGETDGRPLPRSGSQFAFVNSFTSVEGLARSLDSPRSPVEGGRGLLAPLADAAH